MAGVYLSKAQILIPSPPLHIVYVYTIYLFTQEEGEGGEVNQREGWRGNSSQSCVDNTYMIDCISSLYTLINTCRKVPLQVKIFFDDNILFGVNIAN